MPKKRNRPEVQWPPDGIQIHAITQPSSQLTRRTFIFLKSFLKLHPNRKGVKP